MNKNRKISTVALVVILAVLVAGVFFAYSAYLNSYFQNEMQDRLLQSVEQSRYDIETTIKQTFAILDTIALSLSVRGNIVDAESLMLLHEQYRLYEYGLMLIITPDGKGYGSNGKTFSLSDREYFKKAMAGEHVITQMNENRQSGEPAVVLAVPIRRQNKIAGVFVFGFPFAQFRNLLKNNTLVSEAVSYILLADGTIITKTENALDVADIEKIVFSRDMHETIPYRQAAAKSGFYRLGDLSFFASYAKLSVPDWYLLSLIPSNVYFGQWARLFQISIATFFALAVLLVILILIAFFTQQAFAEDLRRSEERYRIVSEQANEIIFEWNLIDDRLELPNQIQKKYSLLPEGKYFRNSWYDGDFIYEEDRDTFIKLFGNAATGIPAYGEDVYRRKKADGTYGWVRTRLTTLFDAQKKPYKVVGVSFDVDEEMNRTLALRARAERDSLTELYNKGFTNSLITGILAESSPEKIRHAFFLIDIDDFKSINDTLGHLFGDEVLHSVGMKLKKAFRPQDITGRVGGDEFAVFLRDVDADHAIIERAEKLQEIFRSERTGRDKTYKVSGSIGIALYPRDGVTYAELYKKADDALYTAKHLGKDRYQIYGES